MKNTSKQKVLVIGGGLGGLSAGISLAQKGYDVSIYEKNNHVGGKLNTMTKDGFTFDLGPSILTMPHIFRKLFEKSGKNMDDYIKITRLENEWRSFFPDESVIDLYGDINKMKSENPGIPAEDIIGYEKFLEYARALYETTEAGYFNQNLDTFGDIIKFHGPIKSLKDFDYFNTMYDAIAKHIKNQNFRDMLAYFIKYVGSSPYDAPAVLNMMIYMQHKQGVWYVPGGMHKIALGLEKLANETGVKIYKNIKVEKLLTQNKNGKNTSKSHGIITTAVLSDSTKIEADIFVSNMEVIPAYENLLDIKGKDLAKTKKKFEPACSGLVLHLGVKKEYPQLSHHNFFFSQSAKKHFDTVFHDNKLPEDPIIYMVNSNKTDPGQSLPGHENLKILPHIPHLQEKDFSDKEYDDFRTRVLIKLEKMGLEDLRKNIITEHMWTPKDIQENYLSDRGAIYGVVSDKNKNHGFKHPKKSKIYDNLYFVGGTVNPGGGMPMVTLSGQQTSDIISR